MRAVIGDASRMDWTALHTTNDIEALRRLAVDAVENFEARIRARDGELQKRDTELQTRDREIHFKDTRIAALTLEIARLRRVQFGTRSEALNPDQRALFDEALGSDAAAVEVELQNLSVPNPPRTERKAALRMTLPADLPRVEVRHEPDACTCGQCGGALTPIGEHVSEKLDCKPLEFFVRRDVHPQYACRACETITAAPVAPAIIDRGIAAPGLIAQVVIQKYTDHLPLYRQEAIFARSGITLSRATLAEWVGAAGFWLQPLVAGLREELLQESVLHADETPVALLDPGAGKTHRAYLFAYRSAVGSPRVVFDFCLSRSGKQAAAFLKDYRGALMVDDYSGYKALFEAGITELGCWAHARRKFHELHQANQSTHAIEALHRIGALYRIEDRAKDFDPQARHAWRQRHAAPHLATFKDWLIHLRQSTLGQSGLAKAIDYTLRRWAALTRYVDDGRYPIDNNPIENAIRPIALGRKNWLFAGSESAGRRAAAIMSLIATAKANGHDPHAWLTDVLTRLPAIPNRRIGELLPHRWRSPDKTV